ncbi:M20/M25/M40 family metallo-hydrolase [candidate division KSB1 bacterium]|nr:M20/M25/M40 family metallo-hydrolase [candidate division KSB1 bacterium]
MNRLKYNIYIIFLTLTGIVAAALAQPTPNLLPDLPAHPKYRSFLEYNMRGLVSQGDLQPVREQHPRIKGRINKNSDWLAQLVKADSLESYIKTLQSFGTRFEYTRQRQNAGRYLFNKLQDTGLMTRYDKYSYQAPLMSVLVHNPYTESIWIGGGKGILAESRDPLLNEWSVRLETGDDFINDLLFIDSMHGWAAGSIGRLYRTIDGGKTWQTMASGEQDYLDGLFFVDSATGWVISFKEYGNNSRILHTRDAGDTWTVQYSSPHPLEELIFISPDSGFAIGNNGTLAKTIDKGETWTTSDLGNYMFEDIQFVDSRTGFIIGGYFSQGVTTSVILRTRDGGATWQEIYSGSNQYFFGMDWLDPQTGWISGWRGDLLRTNDGGAHWIPVDQGENSFIDVQVVDKETRYTITSRAIYVSMDDGENWKSTEPRPFYHTSENIYATLRGSVYPDSSIIIGAHYDSYSTNPYLYAPGADDNASGTSGVLELARILSAMAPKYTLEFWLFSGEELGLFGSKHAAESMRQKEKPLKAMINLDMIAFTNRTSGQVRIQGNQQSEWLVSLLTGMAKYTELTPVDVIMKGGPSDHYHFQEQGYDAVFLIESNEPFNPFYHSPKDEFETLSMPFHAEIVRLVLAGLVSLNDLPLSVQDPFVNQDVPEEFVLFPAYPNPFNGTTTLSYHLPAGTHVRLDVLNTQGQYVTTLVDAEQPAGTHRVIWNGNDLLGQQVSSGVYLTRLQAGENMQQAGKMVLVK